jgi:hypothetical protein
MRTGDSHFLFDWRLRHSHFLFAIVSPRSPDNRRVLEQWRLLLISRARPIEALPNSEQVLAGLRLVFKLNVGVAQNFNRHTEAPFSAMLKPSAVKRVLKPSTLSGPSGNPRFPC